MQTNTQACPSCRGLGVLRNSMGRNEVCPNCGGSGAKEPPVVRVPFDYAFAPAVLAASQQGLQNALQLDSEADFEHLWTVASSTGLYSVQITDRSMGRVLSNAAINGENFAGTAQLPFPFVEPYRWTKSGTILATFNDRSGAGNTVQLVFRGYKLFPAAAK